MIELTTIAQSVSVVAACWAIITGVGAWKREFIGKRKIELAEETLASFFKIKDEFQRHLDEMHRYEGIFWDRYSEKDEIREKLSSVQTSLEAITKPCFEETITTYTIFTKK